MQGGVIFQKRKNENAYDLLGSEKITAVIIACGGSMIHVITSIYPRVQRAQSQRASESSRELQRASEGFESFQRASREFQRASRELPESFQRASRELPESFLESALGLYPCWI